MRWNNVGRPGRRQFGDGRQAGAWQSRLDPDGTESARFDMLASGRARSTVPARPRTFWDASNLKSRLPPTGHAGPGQGPSGQPFERSPGAKCQIAGDSGHFSRFSMPLCTGMIPLKRFVPDPRHRAPSQADFAGLSTRSGGSGMVRTSVRVTARDGTMKGANDARTCKDNRTDRDAG